MSKKREFSGAIEFPCDFVIKVMGRAGDSFEQKVLEIVHSHCQKKHIKKVQKRLSKEGNYLSLTVTIYAVSQAQLDAIYIDLSSDPEIIMAL